MFPSPSPATFSVPGPGYSGQIFRSGTPEVGESSLAGSPESGSVLSVGDDAVLLRTRHLVLQRLGLPLVSGTSRSIPAPPDLLRFSVVILCHTVEYLEQLTLQLHQACPSMPVLLLLPVRHNLSGGYVKAVATEPHRLLAAVSQAFRLTLGKHPVTSVLGTTLRCFT